MMHILSVILIILSVILIPYIIGYKSITNADYNFIESWMLGSVIIILTIIICVICHYIGVMFLAELRVQLK
jgi:hydrogenase-4 membrane subunit HyfE